jgi:RimJ/RimL family protein N-acetyltransferase
MPPLTIDTIRLILVAADRDIARAAWMDVDYLEILLDARIPPTWPPPLMDDTLAFTAETLDAHPDQAGWWAWYFVRRSDRMLVGAGGLKGPPLADGTVEIGYSLFEEFHRQGYGTEAAGGLIEWAFSHPGVTRVVAETYPELTGSIRVMEKNGLRFIGAGSEDRVIRFELPRGIHEARTRGRAPQL